MFVHHFDKTHTGTERVGARQVEFRDGVAEVSVPSLLGRYERLGYVITDARGHDPAAPPLNGSTEAWQAYARTRATSPDDFAAIDDLGRDELIARFGTPLADPVAAG